MKNENNLSKNDKKILTFKTAGAMIQKTNRAQLFVLLRMIVIRRNEYDFVSGTKT